MTKRKRRLLTGAAIFIALAAGLFATPYARPIRVPIMRKLGIVYTTAERLEQYGPAARRRLRPHFERAGVGWPPQRLVLVGIKDTRRLEVYAAGESGSFEFVGAYPILGASGEPGPKLRRGDRQVPEGLYRIESLNPNSSYHLALRLNYPNEFDRQMGAADGRRDLGGDIMIHGSTGSVGCLAMGDRAAEDLFVLAAECGIENIEVILAPADFRQDPALSLPVEPAWTAELYRKIRAALEPLPLPGHRGDRKFIGGKSLNCPTSGG